MEPSGGRLEPERWRVLSPYLDRALDLAPEERGAWIAAIEDDDLARDLRRLLDEHAALDGEGFLSEPAVPPSPSLAGLVVGAYTLRSPLGEGGMGTVWLADRSDGRFEGVAAVKLLNASLVGRDGDLRFRREGNLLAKLRHPNIAQLIDAGVTPLGQPYLVLEHVDGERIDRYCDEAGLGVEERVRLFVEVLGAVAFAHANLVVHRDLKPANVLVARDGRVKLLDFGIAKLIEAESGATLTREGESALTPQYAAPEQLTGGAVTTATDVYASGVLLYLLLTGGHPAGSSITSPSELIRAVVETTPPRPSTVAPANFARTLRGDLDTILAKALEKRPEDRHPSIEAFAADLRRHLEHVPIAARGETVGSRARKFVRRHRAAVVAAGAAGAAVVAGVVGVAWQARETRIQRDAANAQLARATAANEFTTFLLSVAAPGGKTFTVGELLDQGEALIDRQFAGDDAMHAEMLVTVGRQFMISERWDRATPVLERALAFAERTGDPAIEARAACPLALMRVLDGDVPAGEALMARALARLPEGPPHALQRAECLVHHAEFGFVTGEAEPMIDRANAAIAILDGSPQATAPKRIDAKSARAYGLYLAHRQREADAAYAEIVKALEAAGRDRTLAAADAWNNWGLVHFNGDIRRSEPLFRKVVDLRRAIEGEDIAPTFTFNLAGVLHQLARYEEAEPLFEASIRNAAAHGQRRIEFDAMMELSEVYLERGDLSRAAAQLAKLDAFLKDPKFNTFRKAQHAYYAGRIAEAQGDAAAARTSFLEAIAQFDRMPQKIPMNVQALIGVARTEAALGHADSARRAADRALALAESFVEKDAPSYLVGHALAARAGLENPDTARETWRRAAEHLENTLGPEHPAAKLARSRSIA